MDAAAIIAVISGLLALITMIYKSRSDSKAAASALSAETLREVANASKKAGEAIENDDLRTATRELDTIERRVRQRSSG